MAAVRSIFLDVCLELNDECCGIFFPMTLAARRAFRTNGRTLADDVVDVFFSIYTNRNVTDKVGPHRDLLDEFPYLGPPHKVWSVL